MSTIEERLTALETRMATLEARVAPAPEPRVPAPVNGKVTAAAPLDGFIYMFTDLNYVYKMDAHIFNIEVMYDPTAAPVVSHNNRRIFGDVAARDALDDSLALENPPRRARRGIE